MWHHLQKETKKTTKGGKIAHTERETITEKGKKKRFQKGKKQVGKRECEGANRNTRTRRDVSVAIFGNVLR